jgi:carbon-monoxide dehydrogenase medium subunit
MIPQNFEYSTPSSMKEALALLSGGDAKILAGGMSLIPMMKLRLASPEKLVDLRRVPGLTGITEQGGSIRIGAMTTHHEIEDSPVLRSKCPLLAETASNIGDVQVRNMGTIGGSIAHADPAADYPASLIALEAQVRLVSANSDRVIPVSEFFVDAFTTAIEPGEIVLEVLAPVEESDEGHRYEKVAHPASGFAVVGIAVRIKLIAGKISIARIGVTGLGPKAFRAEATERLLEQGTDVQQAAAVLDEGQEANADLFASADYRRHLARVHAIRAIHTAVSRAS